MMVLRNIALTLPAVGNLLSCKIISDVRLLQKHIAIVFFIIQYFAYCFDTPYLATAWSFDIHLHKTAGNGSERCSLGSQLIYQSHHGCLFAYTHKKVRTPCKICVQFTSNAYIKTDRQIGICNAIKRSYLPNSCSSVGVIVFVSTSYPADVK